MTSRAVILLYILFAPVAGLTQTTDIHANPQRMEENIRALSRFGENPGGGVSRVAYSDADVEGRAYVSELMREAGLTVRVDPAGNIIGRRAGKDDDLPVILFGSHIDSVPGGGNYDGDVGVIGAIEAVRLMNDNALVTRHPLEVVVFTDEEGALTGSRAMVGTLDERSLVQVSHSGLTIRDGIRKIGGNPDRLDLAARKTGDLLAYIELHIEQGAILDADDIDIGVVEGIVGIRWWDVTVEGFANHAGTTPMDKRFDAMLGAADFVLAVNRVATTMPGRQVATVGKIQAKPGAPNVIPGEVVLSLEIRDLDAWKMQQVFERIQAEAQQITAARSTPISFRESEDLSPAPTDPRMRRIIAASADALGLSFKLMPSGAGHDAQDMAKIAPAGMIFVPSVDGISHSPREYTSPQDVANGASVLLNTVLAIDDGALE